MLRDSSLPPVGLNIRRARLARRVKQSALADALGVKQAQVSKLETGLCALSLPQLEVIARALSVPVAELTTEQKNSF